MASLSDRAAARRSPPPQGTPHYLEGLNEPQRDAVLTTEGPVLMLAGAGTGKTRALTTRLAHIIHQGLAQPWQVLCVTFTNKASREMRHRIGELVGDTVEGMGWLGTFHSIGAKILRRHAEVVDLKSGFTIIDTDDQVRLCKQVIEAMGLDEKRWTGRGLAGLIDDWKNRGLIPADVPASEAHNFADGRAIDLYRAYQSRLIALNAADFGDLLVHNITIFRTKPDILAEYHRRFKYMLVDEYQDTNVAQYLWLRLLARDETGQSGGNVCVVGDDDQSIYGWRGAEVENILRFEKDFPGAKVIRLEQNYRSTPSILAAASAVIANNKDRLGKTLFTDVPDGPKVKLSGVWDGDEEARGIAEEIEAQQTKGRNLSDMAVLVRASFQMRSFEERFNTNGIPYQVVGGPRFYEREETRDALAYLRLVRNPDDDLSLTRIINKPRRGFGDKAIQMLNVAGRMNGSSLAQAGRFLLETSELKGKAKTSMGEFLDALDRWADAAKDKRPGDLAELVLEESGYTDFWKANKSPTAPGKLENLKELVNAASEFDTLGGYLDHVSLVSERSSESPDGQVWLMTLHAAKGLEFPVVFLPGWEEELFPSRRSVDESGQEGLEEERRLAYVGITRAREECRISFAANRQVYGRWQSALPSRFVDELPEEHVEVASEAGLYGVSAKALPSHSQFAGLVIERESQGSAYDTPGWRRAAKARTSGKEPIVDSTAKLLASSAPGQSDFSIGDRVFHQKFGNGDVERVDGNKLEVAFDHAGTKKVIGSFLVPANAA